MKGIVGVVSLYSRDGRRMGIMYRSVLKNGNICGFVITLKLRYGIRIKEYFVCVCVLAHV